MLPNNVKSALATGTMLVSVIILLGLAPLSPSHALETPGTPGTDLESVAPGASEGLRTTLNQLKISLERMEAALSPPEDEAKAALDEATAELRAAADRAVEDLREAAIATVLDGAGEAEARFMPAAIYVIEDTNTDVGFFTTLFRKPMLLWKGHDLKFGTFTGSEYAGPGLTMSLFDGELRGDPAEVSLGVFYVSAYDKLEVGQLAVGVTLSLTF